MTNGTDAGTAMAKEANQQMVSGTMANIGTRAAAFRDNAANQYYNASNSLAEKEGNLKSAAANARAQNIANSTQAVGQIAANVQQADAGGLFGKSSLGQKFSAWKNKGSQSSSVSLEPAPSNVPMVNKEDPDEDPNHVPFNYTLI